jgi:restriction endonuclease S subunit
MLKGKGIAYLMGFPTYGNGPFEKIDVYTTIPLLIGFLFVCALECISGWGLWSGEKGAAILSFAIIPVEMVFYIGFALPFGPLFLLIRSVFLLISWSSIN